MKLLDLFCGEGLAAWGYWRSSRFSQIIGVDINPDFRDRYSFDFVCADALSLDYEFLDQFDFIHASPPCQFYSKATPEAYRANHPRLIPDVRLMLEASGKPFVIENVEGSSQDLRPNLLMNGQYVGLEMDRKRYFYVSQLPKPLRLMRTRTTSYSIHESSVSRDEMLELMGLHIIPEYRRRCLTKTGIEQGIPPLFTKFIAELVIPHKFYMS